jgi:hypothetical protein
MGVKQVILPLSKFLCFLHKKCHKFQMVSLCHRLNVCSLSPNGHVEGLIPNVVVSGDGDLWG